MSNVLVGINQFGYREYREAAAIFTAIAEHGFPNYADTENLQLYLNTNSGYVFLANDEGTCLMINPNSGKLELFHSTPYNGYEGFLSDLVTEYSPDDLRTDDIDFIINQAKTERLELPEVWQNYIYGSDESDESE